MHFDESDVVRHHLVQRIVRAYDDHKSRPDAQLSLALNGGETCYERKQLCNARLNGRRVAGRQRIRPGSRNLIVA